MPYILMIVILAALDQLVHWLVRASIPMGGHVPLIPGVLGLTYVRNTGAAFSLLTGHTWLLTLVSAVVLAGVAALLWKGVFRHPLGRVPLALVLAGGLGNLIDRAMFGYVTDMFRTLFINFPIFNVADMCITVGGFWLILYVAFGYDRFERAPGAGEGASGKEGEPPAPGADAGEGRDGL